MKVLVTGATGFVGKQVVKQLLDNGHQVVAFSRNKESAARKLPIEVQIFEWKDFSQMPPTEAFSGVEGIIHLAGENIADKRWSDKQKKKISESRILGTRSLISGISQSGIKPVFVATSAIGIYGDQKDKIIDETAGFASDFLASVCKEWEEEAQKNSSALKRLAILRVGVVLGADGGALKKLMPIFKLGAGGPIGRGKQMMSWIHLEDLAKLYVTALENDQYQGIFNATAPYPASNKVFTDALASAVRRPAFFPVPPLALKIAMGEMGQIVTDSAHIIPKKALDCGFEFQYRDIYSALRNIAEN